MSEKRDTLKMLREFRETLARFDAADKDFKATIADNAEMNAEYRKVQAAWQDRFKDGNRLRDEAADQRNALLEKLMRSQFDLLEISIKALRA